jgi:hemoglobin
MKKALLLAAALCAACASSKPAEKKADSNANKPLFDRLGGKPAIEAVVDEFLSRVAVDEKINASFAGANLPKLRQRLVELFCVGTGGPCTYSGRDMKTAHAGMGVTNAQWDAIAADLIGTLDKFQVPEKEKGELLAIVVPMKKDIVEEP